MPNWCYTNIRIVCSKEEQAKKIYEQLKEWENSDVALGTDFERGWLGRFLIQAGITTPENIDSCDVRCRGSIAYIGIDDNVVVIDTETAWAPMLKMWKLIIDKFWKDDVDEILYVATEPGIGLYQSNDPYYDNMYAIWSDDLEISDDEVTESGVIEYILELLDKHDICAEKKDIESLCKEIQYFDLDFSCQKYEIIDIDELN